MTTMSDGWHLEEERQWALYVNNNLFAILRERRDHWIEIEVRDRRGRWIVESRFSSQEAAKSRVARMLQGHVTELSEDAEELLSLANAITKATRDDL